MPILLLASRWGLSQATGTSTITGASKTLASNAHSNATLNNINIGVGESAQLRLTSSTIGVGTTFTGGTGSSVRLTNSSIIFNQSSITVTEPAPVTTRVVPGLETELDLSTMLQIKMNTTFNDIGSLILDGNLYIELNLNGDQFDSFHANVLNAGVAFVLDNDPDFPPPASILKDSIRSTSVSRARRATTTSFTQRSQQE